MVQQLAFIDIILSLILNAESGHIPIVENNAHMQRSGPMYIHARSKVAGSKVMQSTAGQRQHLRTVILVGCAQTAVVGGGDSQTELAQSGSYLYLNGIRFASAPSKVPNLCVIGVLTVIQVSPFTVTPLLGFPKYCYLQ